MSQLAAVFALLAAAPTALLAQGAFTIEQILSSPFPTSLVSSPRGDAVAWVQNDRGRRNIWIASAPEYRGRQLTTYDRDDGQEISDLQFTLASDGLIYVRGGGPNQSGDIPNPTSDPAGAERAVWFVSSSGGPPRRLAEGSSPAVSPIAPQVAYVKGREIWSASLAADREPARWATMRGAPANLRWSPDGTALAFVSRRGDHRFIGVYSVRDSALRFLDPGIDLDDSPVWSPDGRHIAFIRTPHERQRLPYMTRRSAHPWSIRVVDVATGAAREVWRAAQGAGSAFRGIEADDQLFWGLEDRIVFPWERDGWTHLYAVDVRGGEVSLLTPSAFEVQHVALSADRRDVLYSSNQGDIDRRHLWRVAILQGRPRAITTGSGIEWAPVGLRDGDVAFLASDAHRPAHAVVISAAGERRDLAPGTIPSDFPLAALVEPLPVTFAAADGMRIHGQLFVPPDTRRRGPRPAVAFFHGGSRRQMLLGWHHRGYYHNAYALNQYLASRGYIVLSVNYRSGIGYGMDFREALNYGARGASEFHDVLGAGLFLQGRPDVDRERIGLWGGSYGGYLTALGLARASHLFAAGVDVHGVHDWNIEFAFDQRMLPYDVTALDEAQRLAFLSSPVAYVDTWRSPVLFIHGDDDRNVPFRETVDLAELLRARGVEIETLVFPDEVHGFLLHRNWVAAYRAAAEFLERRLGREAAPSAATAVP